MLGFKSFSSASVTIAGVELLRRIHKGQFSFSGLRLKDHTAPALWNAVLAAVWGLWSGAFLPDYGCSVTGVMQQSLPDSGHHGC